MFEAYLLCRSHELQLNFEDQYDFVRFLKRLQELQPKLSEIGVLNLIPIGSAVTKTIRKDSFCMDIILNYNKSSFS